MTDIKRKLQNGTVLSWTTTQQTKKMRWLQLMIWIIHHYRFLVLHCPQLLEGMAGMFGINA